jgi:DNA-binding MarR family transcriptional regulator
MQAGVGMTTEAGEQPAVASDALLDGLRSSPAVLLAQVGQATIRRLRAALTSDAMSPRQFQLLRLLYEQGPIGQQDLGQALDIDPSMLVTLLNPLEVEGLLTRHRDPDDRRRHLVVLTEAGKGRLAVAAQAVRDAEDRLLADLDDADRIRLRELLGLVRVCLVDAGRAASVAPQGSI